MWSNVLNLCTETWLIGMLFSNPTRGPMKNCLILTEVPYKVYRCMD
uniref:Uncharacterized protein n=1 Tax=Anguilla anguilla TaxID=7936 RepID=A0A0E9Q029_ANGAN